MPRNNYNVNNPRGFFDYPGYNCEIGVNVENSSTIFFDGSGTTCVPLSAFVNLSKSPSNILSILNDGLYASGGTGGGSGTVTSVGLQADEIFYHVANSPITTDGVIQLQLFAASGNTVWGNPTNSNNLGDPSYYQPNASILNRWFGAAIQPAIELTTSGSIGAATLIGNQLNIPQYNVSNNNPRDFLSPFDGSFPLSGLFAWYDVNDATTLTFADSNTTISQINDKSGNGYNLPSGGEGTNPPYFGAGGSANRPYITAGGSNYLQATGLATSGSTFPYTFIAVWRAHAGYTATQERLLGFGVDGFGVEGLYTKPVSINGIADQVEIEAYNGNAFTASPGLTYYLPGQWIVTKVVMNNLQSKIFNNRESDQNRINAQQALGNSEFNAVSIGGGQAFDISELLVFNTALTDDQMDKITNYLYLKYQIQDQPYSIAFGDSITFGMQSGTGISGVPPYMAQARQTGTRFYNLAFSSTQVPYDGNGYQFEDIYIYYLKYVNSASKIHFQYGTNDALRGYTVGGSAVAAWQAKYASLISTVIAAGITPSNILLATPPYNSTSANLANCATAVRNIASQLGCTLVDFYQGMITAGLDCGLNGGDGIHPDGAISNFLATTFESFL